jgi:thymidylate synthase (FAD)
MSISPSLRPGIQLLVLSRPSLDADSLGRFLSSHGTSWRNAGQASVADQVIELAGRVCYMSFGENQSDRSNKEYIGNLIRQGHESVLEHVSWTFLLTGVSRGFSHQFVRHRVGFSFSQLSQQYHDESEAQFIVPAILAQDENAAAAWRESIGASLTAYRAIIARLEERLGQAPRGPAGKELRRLIRSAARSTLPNATETKLAFTANARALRHFLKLRGSIGGDEEMRRVSVLLFLLMKTEAPAAFQDFEEQPSEDSIGAVVQRSLSEVENARGAWP